MARYGTNPLTRDCPPSAVLHLSSVDRSQTPSFCCVFDCSFLATVTLTPRVAQTNFNTPNRVPPCGEVEAAELPFDVYFTDQSEEVQHVNESVLPGGRTRPGTANAWVRSLWNWCTVVLRTRDGLTDSSKLECG